MKYRFKRGTTAENDALTEVAGTITIDTDKKQLRIHDGVTQGGTVVPNMDDVVRLENIVSDMSAGAPIFDYLGDIYRIDGGTISPANLTCDGNYQQGTSVISVTDIDNRPGVTKNIVLRNLTDGDEVVIVGLEGNDLTVTPTNKAWTDGAELTTLSETDDPSTNAVVIDITDHVPENVTVTALIANIPVRERGEDTIFPAIHVGAVGEIDVYTKVVSSFTLVHDRWSIAYVTIPITNNRLSVRVSPAGDNFFGHIRVQGYYASI